MFWQFKKVNYDILVPKLEKSIFQLSEDEASQYFMWFMEQIPARVSYVSKVCAKELGISETRMDFSPESLVLLWKWFLRRAQTEPVIQAGDIHARNSASSVPINNRQLTLETEYILRDVGMYFGEVFRTNHPDIYWSYYTKPQRDFFVNHPLLKGFVDMSSGIPFEVVFEPIHMAHIQATKILRKTAKDTDLRDIYNIWSKKA